MNQYLLQFQPRRTPGALGLAEVPMPGNWHNVTDDPMSAMTAIGRLIALNVLDGRRHRGMRSGPVMDQSYFYRVVPVEPLIEHAPPVPLAMLLDR